MEVHTAVLPPADPPRRFQFMYQIHKRVETLLETVFHGLGKGIGRLPVLAIVLSLLVAAAICGGFAFLEANDNPSQSWVPQGSPAVHHQSTIKPYFGPAVHRYLIYVTPKVGQSSLVNV